MCLQLRHCRKKNSFFDGYEKTMFSLFNKKNKQNEQNLFLLVTDLKLFGYCESLEKSYTRVTIYC